MAREIENFYKHLSANIILRFFFSVFSSYKMWIIGIVDVCQAVAELFKIQTRDSVSHHFVCSLVTFGSFSFNTEYNNESD